MGDEQQWYWDDWKNYQTEIKKDLLIQEEWEEAFYNNTNTNNHTVTFNSGAGEDSEMLRVAKDGFYVRGVRVEADADEAAKVYSAFKQWLAWTALATK